MAGHETKGQVLRLASHSPGVKAVVLESTFQEGLEKD